MFTIPNIATASNLICGVLSIMFVFAGRLDFAFYAIGAGALFDFLDGFLARALKKSGELGKQLDSLADMVTFGIAPGLIVFALFIISSVMYLSAAAGVSFSEVWSQETFADNLRFWIQEYLSSLTGGTPSGVITFTGWYLFLPLVSLFIPFMSLFRLAKFNIDTRQTTSFLGLPTPANTIFFSSIGMLVALYFRSDSWEGTTVFILLNEQVLMTLTVIFSVLLITEIPLFALKFKGFGWKGNELRFIFLGLSLILIILLFFWALPIIILLYLILSILDNFLFKNKSNEVQS